MEGISPKREQDGKTILGREAETAESKSSKRMGYNDGNF